MKHLKISTVWVLNVTVLRQKMCAGNNQAGPVRLCCPRSINSQSIPRSNSPNSVSLPSHLFILGLKEIQFPMCLVFSVFLDHKTMNEIWDVRSSLVWGVTQRWLVCCTETSVTIYQSKLCSIAEERRLHLHGAGNQTSRKDLVVKQS